MSSIMGSLAVTSAKERMGFTLVVEMNSNHLFGDFDFAVMAIATSMIASLAASPHGVIWPRRRWRTCGI
ncbi:MAG: hypothetical protein JRG71_07680 [Deltaproteobacteria bacterium]|nr:hypothetical protein [Deltaproteobacteria bacterium]